MDITVEEVLQLEPLKKAQLVAGRHRITNIVKGITIIERPDIVEWLEGGEILLTSLYNVKQEIASPADYIKKMVQKGVSALIIKTGRVVIKTPDEILVAGDTYGLPIIEVGQDVRYIDIMYPVMAEVFNDQVIKLKHYKEVQKKFTELVIAGEGLEGIAKTLEQLINNPVVIYDKRFRMLATTDSKVVAFAEIQRSLQEESLNEKMEYYRQEVLLPDMNNEKVTQVVVPIHQFNKKGAFLVVIEKNKKLGDLEYIILENASTVVALELVKRFAIGEVERKFKYDLLDSLVSGNFHLETVLERASLMGWDLTGSFCVFIMEFMNINDYLQNRENRNTFLTEIGNIVGNIINQYTRHFMRVKSDSLYVLWPVDKKQPNEVVAEIRKAVKKITATLRKKFTKIKVYTGVGGVVSNISEIQNSFKEAVDAVDYAKSGNEDFVCFSDLGIMRLLYKFSDKNDLTEFIPKCINKLEDYDREHNANLLETLEVFLQTNSNAAQTAKKLYVHYKTVLYRLEKIKEVSGIDLTDNKERLEAEIGLKIINLLKNHHIKKQF